MIFIKKVILIAIIISIFISSNVYGDTSKEISEKELVEIYIIALDSFIPQEKYLENKSYIAIDMKSAVYESISLKSKQQILDYFKNKYNIEIINASYHTLKAIGLITGKFEALKSNGKRGVFLAIDGVDFKSNNEVVITGYWYTSEVSAEFYKDIIVLKDGKWMLKEKNYDWD